MRKANEIVELIHGDEYVAIDSPVDLIYGLLQRLHVTTEISMGEKLATENIPTPGDDHFSRCVGIFGNMILDDGISNLLILAFAQLLDHLLFVFREGFLGDGIC